MVEIARHGTNYYNQTRLNQLRQDIQTEHRRLYEQAWDNIISKMDIETDHKKFWTNIKKLQGNENKSRDQTSETKTDKMFMSTKTKKLYLGTTGKRLLIYQTLKT